MLGARQDAFPLRCRHQARHSDLDEVLRLLFEGLGWVHDEAEFLLGSAFVVVQLGLVAQSLKPLHVHVQVEVSSHDRYRLEDLQALERKRLKLGVQEEDNALDA